MTEAIRENLCRKVYIPSRVLTLMDQIETLRNYLKKGNPGIPARRVLDCVLIDSENGGYSGQVDRKRLAELGIELIDCPVVSAEGTPYREIWGRAVIKDYVSLLAMRRVHDRFSAGKGKGKRQ